MEYYNSCVSIGGPGEEYGYDGSELGEDNMSNNGSKTFLWAIRYIDFLSSAGIEKDFTLIKHFEIFSMIIVLYSSKNLPRQRKVRCKHLRIQY